MGCCGGQRASDRDAGERERDAGGGGEGFEAAVVLRWWRLGLGVLLAIWGMLLALAINTSEAEPSTVRTIHAVLAGMAALSLVLLGGPLFADTLRSLRRGRLTIEPLFVSALLGAAGYSAVNALRGEGAVYFETVVVVLVIYTIGTRIKGGAQSRAAAALRAMGEAERAVRVVRDGRVVERPVDAVVAGDLIEVRPGEAVPAEGTVESGHALVETASLTGEPFPRPRGPGDAIPAGAHSVDGLLRVRVRVAAAESDLVRAVSTIGPDLVERSAAVARGHRVLRWFIPAVWAAALGTFAAWAAAGRPGDGLMHALAVLLVACPCALGFAAPTAVWAGLTRLSRLGLRVRDPDIVESLAEVRVAMIDKTGTITSPEAEVESFEIMGRAPVEADLLRAWIGAIERRCDHPLAAPLGGLAGDADADAVDVGSVRLLPGRGLEARVEDAGRSRRVALVRDQACDDALVHRLRVEVDGAVAASIGLRESVHDRWPAVRRSFSSLGVETVVVTGDARARAELVEADRCYASVGPGRKRELVRDERERGGAVLFVGDGVNDAPAMACADASIAVEAGAALANAAAQASIPADRIGGLPEMIAIARHASGVLRSNVRLSLAYNAAGVSVAAAGLLHPALAAVLMVVSSLIVTARAFSVAEVSIDAGDAAGASRSGDAGGRPGPGLAVADTATAAPAA